MKPELRDALEAVGVRETDANGKPDPVWIAFSLLGQGGLSPDQAAAQRVDVKNAVTAALRDVRRLEWNRYTVTVVATHCICALLGVIIGMGMVL